MTSPKLLIVDDEPRIREFFVRVFSDEGWVVAGAADGIAAKEILKKEEFDVLVTDLKMPRMDGIALLKWVNKNFPETQKIVLTAYGSLDAAVTAVREGTYDFISKPIQNFEKLKITVRRAFDARSLKRENVRLITELKGKNQQLTERLSELQVAYDLLKEQSRALKEDLVTAQRIQLHLLPRKFPESEKISFASFYQPSRNVGGDIFDVVQIDEDNIVVYIADASGHGVSSAMMAVFIKQLVKPFRIENERSLVLSPAQVLKYLNEMIFTEGVQDTVFVTMLYVHIDLSNMKMVVATAGHPPLLIRRRKGSVEHIGCNCPALGIRRESEFRQQEIEFERDDVVVIYTDGITDCENDKAEQFGRQGIIDLIESAGSSPSEVYRALVNGISDFAADNPQEDDMSMLLFGFTNEKIAAVPMAMPHRHMRTKTAEHLPHNHILYRQEGGRLYFVVKGKGNWKESRPLLNSFKNAIDRGTEQVVVDLSGSPYLDSTFLGTLQQMADIAERTGGLELSLQNVPGNVLVALKELVMTSVIERINNSPYDLPEAMREITVGAVDRGEYAEHILETHELLSRLSEKNREKFQALIEALRHSPKNDSRKKH